MSSEQPPDNTHRRVHANVSRHAGSVARHNASTGLLDQETVAAWRGLKMTVGAESSDVIAVTCQLVDGAGDDVAEARDVLFEMYEATMIEAVAAAFTLAATTGTEVSTTANARLLVTLTAAGLAVLDVTDAAGASGKSPRLSASLHEDQTTAVAPTPYGGYAGSVPMTFD